MAENRDSGKKRVGEARSGPGAGMGCQVNLGKMKRLGTESRRMDPGESGVSFGDP